MKKNVPNVSAHISNPTRVLLIDCPKLWPLRCCATTLHYTTLHYTTLHYTTLHYTTLHYTTLHYTTLHYTTLHYTTLHYTTLHYTTLHYTTLHYTTLSYTQLDIAVMCNSTLIKHSNVTNDTDKIDLFSKRKSTVLLAT